MLFGSKTAVPRAVARKHDSFLHSFKVKRALDIAGAVTTLIVFSPVLLVCIAAIRLSGERKVIFSQRRVGLDGKAFDLLKLTTMREDAHLRGPLISTSNDSRVIPIGRLLRGFGLNELPQLINVLRGEMSLVGPRPEVPRYSDEWDPAIKKRILSVRPGITGLATMRIWDEASLLAGRDDVERAYLEEVLPNKLRVDMWYVRHRSLWLDLNILVLTLVKALGGNRLFGSARGVPQVWPPEDGL